MSHEAYKYVEYAPEDTDDAIRKVDEAQVACGNPNIEQVDDELLVVLDRVHLRVEPREAVERPVRLDAGDPRDVVEQPVGELDLLVEAAAGDDELAEDALERRVLVESL